MATERNKLAGVKRTGVISGSETERNRAKQISRQSPRLQSTPPNWRTTTTSPRQSLPCHEKKKLSHPRGFAFKTKNDWL